MINYYKYKIIYYKLNSIDKTYEQISDKSFDTFIIKGSKENVYDILNSAKDKYQWESVDELEYINIKTNVLALLKN